MSYRTYRLAVAGLLAGLFGVAGCSSSDREEPTVDEIAEWKIAGWRDAYCKRDTHPDNRPFASDQWRSGDRIARDLMARDLICSTQAYGRGKAEILELLGPADAADEYEVIIYRISRPWGFRRYEAPAPAGHHIVPDGYDLRFNFGSDGALNWIDWLPTIEADS